MNGTFYYQNSAGQYIPLVNATVEIWESDTFEDDYLTSVITNQNGEFSISLCDNDGIFDSNLEIYAIGTTANEKVKVLNYTEPGGPYGFAPFAWATWVEETGGGTVNFENLIIGAGMMNSGGAKIFDNMQKGWSASVNRGFDPSYTPTVYPLDCAGTSFYAFSGWTNPFDGCDFSTWGTGLGAIYMQSEEWINGNEDVSYHEYGHALMHRAFSDEWYPDTDGGSHDVIPQPQGFAWSEGWASFYTQIVENDGNYNGYSNLEDKEYIFNLTTGEVNEWRVSQALVDLWDDNNENEDNSSINYIKLISTMHANNSNSLTEFWGQLKSSLSNWNKYYGSKSLIYNTISVEQEPEPITPPVISNLTQSPDPICQGTIGYVYCNLSQGNGNLNYSWSASNLPSGASITPMGDKCKVTYSYSKLAQKGSAAPGEIKAPVNEITCTVSNSAGSDTESRKSSPGRNKTVG